jgi:hypothetical protein
MFFPGAPVEIIFMEDGLPSGSLRQQSRALEELGTVVGRSVLEAGVGNEELCELPFSVEVQANHSLYTVKVGGPQSTVFVRATARELSEGLVELKSGY